MRYALPIILLLILFLCAPPVLAVGLDNSTGFLNAAAGEAGYRITEKSPENIIAKVINVALSFLGVIFLVLMIYGGFLWMTARGNDQQVDKAKGVITAAIIGVVIVVSAYAITYLVVSQIGGQALQ